MPLNPFVALWEDPVTTLTALAYALALLGSSVGVAGAAYRTGLRLYLEVHHRRDGRNYAPEWEYVPPWRVIGIAVGVFALAAVWAALVAGVIFMLA